MIPRKKKNVFGTLEKKEHPLRFLYPVAAKLYPLFEKTGLSELIGDGDFHGRHGFEDDSIEYRKLDGYKTISCMIMILICTAAALLICLIAGSKQNNPSNTLQRARPGNGVLEYEMSVKNRDAGEEAEMVVKVSEQKCPDDKLEDLFEDAAEKLGTILIKDNKSADEITGSISLVKKIPGTSVEVRFDDPDPDYVYPDGTIRFDKVTEPVIIYLSAELSYFEETRTVTFPLRLIPRKKEAKEQFLDSVDRAVKEADRDNSSEEYLLLPDNIDGEALEWNEKKSSPAGPVAVFGMMAVIGVIPARMAEIKKKKRIREQEMIREYPDIISKLSLLLTAGMTCSAAWEKICLDYESQRSISEKEVGKGVYKGNNKKSSAVFRFAYEEMMRSLGELRFGRSEYEVYEDFGNRCGIAEYKRLGSLLSKNLKRGSREITGLLQAEAENALEERREKAKERGEEVGTKLLFPMIGMLGIVIAIVVVPAIRSMGL